MSFYKPWEGPRMATYPTADSMADAVQGFRRCRTLQHFILTDEAFRNGPPADCAWCHKPVTNTADLPLNGNRGIYSARHKRAVLLHYYCSWEALLKGIFRT